MRKLAQLAVIVAASVLTIMSAVDVADLLVQAHADPLCAAGGADPCQARADPPQADPPLLRTVCTGGGPKTGGAHCWQVPAPRINLQP